MRKVIVAIVAIGFFALRMHAQGEYPAAEIFGGFSIQNVGNGDGERESLLGWQVSINGNAYRYFGLVADFGGQYKSIRGDTLQAYQFLFGPQFAVRRERVTAFAHALFGLEHARSRGESANGFLLGFGGGLDLNVSRRIAIRFPQLDYLPSRSQGEWYTKDFRVGVGIVFKTGQGQ